MLEDHAELHAGLPRRCGHRIRLTHIERQRLLAQHVLAGPGGVDSDVTVEMMRKAQRDDMDVAPRENAR